MAWFDEKIGMELCHAHKVRKLERERDEARSECDTWKDIADDVLKRCNEALEERSALRAEVERIKAANEQLVELAQKYAIDAAMKADA